MSLRGSVGNSVQLGGTGSNLFFFFVVVSFFFRRNGRLKRSRLFFFQISQAFFQKFLAPTVFTNKNPPVSTALQIYSSFPYFDSLDTMAKPVAVTIDISLLSGVFL